MKKIIFKIPHGIKEAVYSDKQWDDIEKLIIEMYEYINNYIERDKKEFKKFSVEKDFKKDWKDLMKRDRDFIEHMKRSYYKVPLDIPEDEFKGVVKLFCEQFFENFNKSLRDLETLRLVVEKLKKMETVLFLTEAQIKQVEETFINELALKTQNLYDTRGRIDHEYVDYLYMLLYRIQGKNLYTGSFCKKEFFSNKEMEINEYGEKQKKKLTEKAIQYYKKLSKEDLKNIMDKNL